jgi:hypothetical protein
MRRSLLLIAACLGVAGCSSVPVAIGPMTEQTTSSKKADAGSDWSDADYRLHRRALAARSQIIPAISPDGRTSPSTSSEDVTGSTAARLPNTNSSRLRQAAMKDDEDLKPFTPEWYAREEANDARLRRHLQICSGC